MHIISLGSFCITSQMCKVLNMKLFSCPFDWIFSNSSMITSCLKTNFEIFLDKTKYVNVDENTCSHSIYDVELPIFNHHNPIREDHYKYFQRCIERFNDCLYSGEKILFIQTATHISKDFEAEKALFASLQTYCKGTFSYMLIVLQSEYVSTPEYSEHEHIINNDNVMKIYNFHRISDCTGVQFVDESDNTKFKELLKSFTVV